MARFRLRFLLQEFDLPQGETLIGRSADCHITIEDPLVSRKHARIDLHNGRAAVVDLGARNGVRVNGDAIKGEHQLQHGDRIRIGKQELVFTRIDSSRNELKITGFLRHCATCRLPYPEESGACPNCGSHELLAEETLTTRQIDVHADAWQLSLVTDILSRFVAQARWEEAEKVLRRLTTDLDARADDAPFAEGDLTSLVELTARVASATSNITWACWVVRLHKQAKTAPTEGSLAVFTHLLRAFPVEVSDAVTELAGYFEAAGDHKTAVRLQRLNDEARGDNSAAERAT